MNEVEKMYENCNIEPKQKGYCDCGTFCPYPHHKCNDECSYWKYEDEAKYPPFTAEKQLELIKQISKKRTFKRVHVKLGYKYILRLANVEDGEPYQGLSNDSFEEALANLVLDLLRDVKRYEKNKIKEILE